MVFYRKYRPQTIAQLDSENARNSLLAIISSHKIPHAFLFTGPKGLGKTSAARIVAKIVNCEKRNQESGIRNHGNKKLDKKSPDSKFKIHNSSSIEPCNKCDQCISIINGTNLDVLEIDAASNRGIDEIRALREKISLAPSAAKKKVYIIDEVHMLTNEAFNALLKMLEEPPPHVMFILCTTEVEKIPDTIKSRCFSIAFKKATHEEIARSLGRIVKAEKLTIDTRAIAAVAAVSDGSFRDGAKLLEAAVLAQGKKSITKEVILEMTGGMIFSGEFIKNLQERNVKELLIWLAASMDKGLDMKLWLEDLLAALHSGLLDLYGVTHGGQLYKVGGFSEQELKQLIALFSRAHRELKFAVIPQLPVELAVIEYCMENPKS